MSTKPVKKRINFYQVQARKVNDDERLNLPKSEIKICLESMFAKLKFNTNGYAYKQFQMGFNNYIIELIKSEDSMLFARIGKQTNESTIGKRDIATGNLLNIDLQDGESIESYTYLHLDLSNMILSYLVLSGTPSRTSFSYFLNEAIEEIDFECVPITTEDVLKRLATKSIFGTIEYSYCNPKESVTYDVPGINKRFLTSLNADKTVITVSLRPKKSKSITKTIKDIFIVNN